MMKVKEAVPFKSMMKRGNRDQGRGETRRKIDRIGFTKKKKMLREERKNGGEKSGDIKKIRSNKTALRELKKKKLVK